MANQITHQSKWTPKIGALLFVITMIWLVFGSYFITFRIGAWGQIVLELVLLAIAVVPAIINKTPLKELFPVKKITVRDFFGATLMWAGSLILGFISIFAVSTFLPQGLAQDGDALAKMASSSIAIIAFIGMVIHFFQNFICIGISLIGGYYATSSDVTEAGDALQSLDMGSFSTFALGLFMIMGFFAPVLIAVGAHLIKRQAEIEANTAPKGMKLWVKLLISGVLSVALFIGGIAVLVTSASESDYSDFITVEAGVEAQVDLNE